MSRYHMTMSSLLGRNPSYCRDFTHRTLPPSYCRDFTAKILTPFLLQRRYPFLQTFNPLFTAQTLTLYSLQGETFDVPEVVPFRLTHNMVHGLVRNCMQGSVLMHQLFVKNFFSMLLCVATTNFEQNCQIKSLPFCDNNFRV